jgi:phenylpropionate dioxygenase-like ring-hydroxylating dioxygenase large terminal subunit
MSEPKVFRGFDFFRTLRPFADAVTLSPRAYADPEFYRVEVERIFRREWMSVGRVEQVAGVGDYFTLDLFDEPIVVVRGEDDRVRTLSTVCRHRGMPVVDGAGSRRSFQCPYHLWTYSLDGKLRGAPGMEPVAGFDRDHCVLPEIRTEIWEGWIFVNFDSAAAPLSDTIAPLTRELAPFRLADFRATEAMVYDSPWNWKVMVDNFMESYHHMAIHPDTLQPYFPAMGTYADDVEGPYAILHNPTEGRHPLEPIFPAREVPEQCRSEFVVACVFPFHLFACTADAMQYFQLIPDGPRHLTLRIYQCVPAEVRDDPGWKEAIEHSRAFVDRINRQDIVANTGMQRGYLSAMAQSGRYAPQEKALWQFHRWLLTRIFGEDV